MQIIETPIQGLLEIQPKVFGDKRGFFLETWQKNGMKRLESIINSFRIIARSLQEAH